MELPVVDYGTFQDAIEFCMLEQVLQPESCMIRKVIQLYETMIVRWGVMLVGPTGGGKSTILNVSSGSPRLKEGLKKLGFADSKDGADQNVRRRF